MPKLKVKSNGRTMVHRHEQLFATAIGARQFIGWTVSVEGEGESAVTTFTSTDEVFEVPSVKENDPTFGTLLSEYRREVIEGALLPADEATAKYCGVAMPAPAAAVKASKSTATASVKE